MSIILAIDASLRSTGWAIVQGERVLHFGKIVTKKHTGENLDVTITSIVKDLLEISQTHEVNRIGLEDGYVGKNSKTALQLAGLRQSLVTTFYLAGLHVTSLQPSQVRSLLIGKGSASKEEVAAYLKENYKDDLKNLGPFSDKSNKHKTSDIYDAIAIGLATSRV